jgi:hypothetical protein
MPAFTFYDDRFDFLSVIPKFMKPEEGPIKAFRFIKGKNNYPYFKK